MTMKKRTKKLIIILAVVVVIAAALFTFFVSPLCVIKEVDTSCAFGCTPAQEQYLKEKYEGKNAFFAGGFFGKKTKAAEEKVLSENPFVKSISIRYDFPNKMIASSAARERAFLAEYYGMYLCLDTEGVLLETYSKDDAPDLPVISGLAVREAKTGSPVFDGKDEKANDAIRLCAILRSYGFYDTGVDIIDMNDGECVWMYFAPSLSVKFGSVKDADSKVAKLKSIIALGYSGESDGIIDFTAGNDPIFRKNKKPEGWQPADPEENPEENNIENQP